MALVDEADFDWLSRWRWCICVGPNGHLYARRNATVAERATGRPWSIYMHREVGASADAPCVDHINRQTLDNRRANLRPATYSQNSANSSVPPGACPYRGVTFDGRRIKRPYRAHIRDRSVNLSLGSFADPQDAARAYDAAALRLFGEFAALNFPEAA